MAQEARDEHGRPEESGEPTIVERPEMLLVGLVSLGGDIGALWERYMPRESLIQHRVGGAWWELHVHPKDQAPGAPYWILVGVEVTELEAVPDELFVKPIPAGQYAVFPHRPGLGEPNHGYDALNRRVEAWLETGPYRVAREFSLQLYDARFKGMEDPDSVEDLLIPIRPKG